MSAAPSAATATVSVRVWDLPTRLFHWLLALAVVGLAVTGHVGGNALQWHMRLGVLVLVLLGFRLVWGVVGGHWSRFASFVYPPAAILRYLRGQPAPGDRFEVGHNPLGAFSVFALIGMLAVQVATGLVSDDEIATTGPLNKFVASATGLAATSWHRGWGQWILVALVALHVVAIVLYRRKGTDLVTPMLRGDKQLSAADAVPASVDTAGSRIKALVILLLWLGVAGWIFRQG